MARVGDARAVNSKAIPKLDPRLAVAPMMDCTDRHARYLLRLVTRRTLLYTEMVTAAALRYGDPAQHLAYHPLEHPLALQAGGSDPLEMARAAELAARYGYDEVNINVGCPSDRVQSGRFGACLMAEPDTVARCVRAMCAASLLPVTVKTRIGIDDCDSYEHLGAFVERVADAGCGTFIVHARKAWLHGLSPKENRERPPLQYERVRRLKRDYPELRIVLNGGIRSLAAARAQLGAVDGVMIGREAYGNPYMLAGADREIFGERSPVPTRRQIVLRYLAYVESELREGVPASRLLRHLLGLFHAAPGARRWRRQVSAAAQARTGRPHAIMDEVRDALERVSPAAPQARGACRTPDESAAEVGELVKVPPRPPRRSPNAAEAREPRRT